jgi:hypothetical protein
MTPAQTSGPNGDLVVVVGGAEEVAYFITSHGTTRQGAYQIDPWY